MFSGLELMACHDLAVPAQVMQHVVQVESHGNPYAIGVVGARLQRQPRSLDEALATVHMLDAGNYDYSLGLAQINRANLQPYGLDSYRQAFTPCANVAAGARILADCYASFGRHWGKALSCYYAGDPVTGYRDGYVQKIYTAVRHEGGAANPTTAPAMHKVSLPPTAGSHPPAPGDRAWRLAIRSAPIDQASAAVHAGGHAGPTNPTAGQAATDVFVPQVRGPHDPAPASASGGPPPPAAATTGTGQADSPTEHRDAAFVF